MLVQEVVKTAMPQPLNAQKFQSEYNVKLKKGSAVFSFSMTNNELSHLHCKPSAHHERLSGETKNINTATAQQLCTIKK